MSSSLPLRSQGYEKNAEQVSRNGGARDWTLVYPISTSFSPLRLIFSAFFFCHYRVWAPCAAIRQNVGNFIVPCLRVPLMPASLFPANASAFHQSCLFCFLFSCLHIAGGGTEGIALDQGALATFIDSHIESRYGERYRVTRLTETVRILTLLFCRSCTNTPTPPPKLCTTVVPTRIPMIMLARLWRCWPPGNTNCMHVLSR